MTASRPGKDTQNPLHLANNPLKREIELNELSYLVRKYPDEAMSHLNAKEMLEEAQRRIEAYERIAADKIEEAMSCGKSTDISK